MDEGDLRAVIDHARDALDEDPGMSDRATELRVVLPLLKALGWEIHGPDVAVDHAVDAGDGDPDARSRGVGDDEAPADGHGAPTEEHEAPADGERDGPPNDGAEDGPDRTEDTEGSAGGTDDASETEGSGDAPETEGGVDTPESEGAADPPDPGVTGAEGNGGVDPGEFDDLAVDYALLVGDEPAVLLSTAAADEDLGEGAVERLSAALTAAGVELGLATNGHSFVFLASREDRVDRAETSLAALAEDPAPLSHYTRAAARQRRRRCRRERRRGVAEDLSEDRETAVGAVGEALAEAAGTDLDGELAAAGEAFVDRVLDALSTGDHPETAVTGPGDLSGGDEAGGRSGSADADGRSGGEAVPDPDRERPDGDATDDAPREADGPERASGGGGATGTAGTDDGDGTARPAGSPGQGSGPDADARAGSRTDDRRGGSPVQESGAGSTTGDRETAGDRTAAGEGIGPGDGQPSGDGSEASESDGGDGEYVVRFFSDRASVGAVGHGTPEGAMAQAVDYLIDRHALGNRLRVPWGPEDADGRAIIGREPVHPDGTEMSATAELSEGYYLYTDLPAAASRQVVERLASKAGLRVMFQGDWADGGA